MNPAAPPPPSVAIVAWQALPVILPKAAGAIGGIETAAWTFARGLAMHTAFAPVIVVRGSRRTVVEQVDGVRLWVDIDRWLPLRRQVSQYLEVTPAIRLKRFSPRLLWQVPLLAVTWPWRRRDPEPMQPDPRLIDVQPTIWVAMGVGRESAGVIATAKQTGRPSVLMIRSNADLDAGYAADPNYRSPYGERGDQCLFALREADRIVCQSQHQMQLLRERFGRQGVLIRNPIELERWHAQPPANRGGVLWVGRYERFAKRVHLAVQIAALCPEIPFRMVAAPSDPQVRRAVRANSPKNIQWLDRVPFQEMPDTFAASRLLLCTSDASAEGFPNVLLQAAAAETPIVSLADFDGFIRDCGAGVVCDGDVHLAAEQIRQLYDGQSPGPDYQRVGDYLRQHHDLPAVAQQLAQVLSQTCQDHRQPAAPPTRESPAQ